MGRADALGTACAKAVRRRVEGDETTVVTPEVLAGTLGAPTPPESEARRPHRAVRAWRSGCGRRWSAETCSSSRPAACPARVTGPDRPPGEGDAGVSACCAVLAARQRRVLRHRPRLLPGHRWHLHLSGKVPNEGASGVTGTRGSLRDRHRRPVGPGPAGPRPRAGRGVLVGVATGQRARDRAPTPGQAATPLPSPDRHIPATAGYAGRHRKRAHPATTSPRCAWTRVQYPAPPPSE